MAASINSAPLTISGFSIPQLNIGYKPANNLVKAFVDLEILKQMPDRQRNRLFYFEEYLALFNVPEEE